MLHRKAQTAWAAEVLKNPDTQKIRFFFPEKLGIFEILFVNEFKVYYANYWARNFFFLNTESPDSREWCLKENT